MIDYEWDPIKADSNLKTHGIDFADAVGVFEDCFALVRQDPRHIEDRFVVVASDFQGRILTVVYTYRKESIRIISARKATSREKKQYAAT